MHMSALARLSMARSTKCSPVTMEMKHTRLMKNHMPGGSMTLSKNAWPQLVSINVHSPVTRSRMEKARLPPMTSCMISRLLLALSLLRNRLSRLRVLLCRLSCSLNICISLITSVFSRRLCSSSRAHCSSDSRSFSRSTRSERNCGVCRVSSITLYAGSDWPSAAVAAEMSGMSAEVALACVSSESRRLACLHASITRRRISARPDGFPMWQLMASWMESMSLSISYRRWKNVLTKMRRDITDACTTMSCSNLRPLAPLTMRPFSPLTSTPPPGRSAAALTRPVICEMSFSASSPSSSLSTATAGSRLSTRNAVNMLNWYLELIVGMSDFTTLSVRESV
mmetsp:Transcript_28331/g.69769  ORF Transcript_28331/g.69769 Transcript_28331/m.69769 type:complete len:339 (+) Transcript_28331:869-1885(+)